MVGPASFLRQHELRVQIDHDQTLPPRALGYGLLIVVIHTAYEERADGARTEAGGIDRHLDTASKAGQRHAMDHFVQGSGDRGFVQPRREAIKNHAVRNGPKLENAAQFRAFGQSR